MQKNKIRSSYSFLFQLFYLLLLGLHLGCQNNSNYIYLTGEGRCANGKQDPDEFGVDCGGACPNNCQDLRYLEGEIFGRLSLDTRYDYILTGPLIVRDQASLEFPAGTHLKVQANVGAYIAVVQGGLLFTWGTAQAPVTISSNAPEPSAGDWGGIIFCGQSPLEGADRKLSPIGNYYYGGDIPNDISGYLRYLKIEHAGAAYNEQLNYSALNFFGVGRSTVVDHVWIDNVLHHGIDIIGGNVEMEDMVVRAAQQNALSIRSNWGGNGNRLFFHQSGANGIMIQDPVDTVSISSSFTLSNIAVVNASGNGIGIASRMGQAVFDRFTLSELPGAFQFSSTYEAAFPFQWQNFYLENVNQVSNDDAFTSQFEAITTPPFSNPTAFPSWLESWQEN